MAPCCKLYHSAASSKLIADVAAGAACGGILVDRALAGHWPACSAVPCPGRRRLCASCSCGWSFSASPPASAPSKSARVVVFMTMARRFFHHLAVPIYVGVFGPLLRHHGLDWRHPGSPANHDERDGRDACLCRCGSSALLCRCPRSSQCLPSSNPCEPAAI